MAGTKHLYNKIHIVMELKKSRPKGGQRKSGNDHRKSARRKDDVLDVRAAGARRLENKICIVTGAGQGIGRSTARRLSQEGGVIVVAERMAESAARTFSELIVHGEAMKVTIDVSTFAGAQALIKETVGKYNRVDVLVNNAGGSIWWQPYHKFTEEQVKLEIERSLYTALWCSLAVLPVMMEQRFGSIVNVASGVTRGSLYRTPYAVAKGGVVSLTRTLAREYGIYGIRVNAVSPGGTAITDRITPRSMIKPGIMVEETDPVRLAEYHHEVEKEEQLRAIKRPGRPEEQASVIAFLASDDASYVTGQIIECRGEP
jgi:NAD(P)-dependent dehydrogenase (short-subunit alcohol dehydrogenase family)